MKSSSSGGRNSQVPWRESQSGNYKKSNDVNFLQLLPSKNNEEGSISSDIRVNNKNSFNISNNDSSNIKRGNSMSKQQQNKVQFSKKYSVDISNTESFVNAEKKEQGSKIVEDSKGSPIKQL